MEEMNIFLKNVIFNLSNISFLTYKTNMIIKVERYKGDCYVISLMEGASIIKL